ncbi:glycosyltransferase family 4 protein [Mesorhizobium xinjiangense]|uniref:glycosyltransferase family 4 protein n=1 Tax=Mesorhizobium xinjiangense TaxID=2678685 RepID=UPI0012EEDAB6|nr:glycosyltransferase family 4 protein [Mesorhizobium xinjiangense]
MPIADGTIRRVAFYAPMKPPDHPIASGDREIARLIMVALGHAGCTVEQASFFIAYQKRPSHELFEARRSEGMAAARTILADFEARPATERPQLWLTYHPYCKAPDWIGPSVAKALDIPYATVEACRTRQNTDADWMPGRLAVQEAVGQAAANFCMKRSDFDYLSSFLPDTGSIVALAPFIDIEAARARPASAPPSVFNNDDPVILAVGMMRPGKKMASYRLLADALEQIRDRRWNLVIVGNGPGMDEVRERFAFLEAKRIHLAGALAREAVLGWMRQSAIFAWPGYRESIGMVYLEAQANGLPVVALRSLGVPDVVAGDATGLLVDEGDAAGYAAAIATMLDDPALRRRLGAAGQRHVQARHGIEAASATFRRAFDELANAK